MTGPTLTGCNCQDTKSKALRLVASSSMRVCIVNYFILENSEGGPKKAEDRLNDWTELDMTTARIPKAKL